MNDISVTPAIVTQNICVECRQPFDAKRGDAKCCSQNCRKRRSRRKATMHREMMNALDHVNQIKRMMEKHDDLMELGLEYLGKIEVKTRVTLAGVTLNR